ncbi:MAG: hypothetical protein GY913_33670 [Proteobacteria bacterium]|nr:hypothetical protein [Pseudomonadota bacterium]MCP4921877.1 hypothetical protein [Pseudomonadota bacterium]
MIWAWLACTCASPGPQTQRVEDFRLIDQHGDSHALQYHAGVVTLVGWTPDCPVPAPAGDQVFGIAPLGVDRADVDADFPVLMDEMGLIAPSLGIVRAGDTVVFDLEQDTWIRTADGLDCAFPEPEPPPALADVLPTLRACAECHHDNARYPLFRSFDELHGWSAMIRHTVRTQRMPPGGHDAYYSSVEGALTSDQLGDLVRWLEAGLPRDAEAPDPMPELSRVASIKPRMGRPDITFTMEETHELPAAGPDEYRYATLGTLTEDTWIRGVRLTLNQDVVHHVNLVAIDEPLEQEVFLAKGTSDMLRLRKSKGDGKHFATDDAGGADLHLIEHMMEERILMTYGRSKRTLKLEDGRAIRVPAGTILAAEIHYGLTGKVEENRISVMLYEAEGEPREVKRANLYRGEFEIPAHTSDHTMTTGLELKTDITVLEMVPHMHQRGKSVRYLAVSPDGTEEVLLNIPFFQYKYQPHWRLTEPKHLAAGTRLVTEVVYDNSDRNPINPDPGAVVKNGSQRIQEMHLPRFYYVEGTL